MRFWSSPPHRDLERTRAWLADMMADGPPLSDDFVIEHDGRVIGKAGCWRLPEIGFILHPRCWGQGFAAEACNAVIAHVFDAGVRRSSDHRPTSTRATRPRCAC